MPERSLLQPGGRIFPRLFVFFASFSVFLFFSVAPTLYPGDSPLFISAAYFLGSAHPPGYPLHVSVAKIFTFLPFGNIAFKANLLSAVSGGLAILLAYESVYQLTGSLVSGILAALMILASPNFVLESSKAEVYSFNSFLIMLIFYLCIRALRDDPFDFRKILLAFLVFGLGMGNHHTLGFMLLGMVYVMFVRRSSMPKGMAVISTLLALAGFLIYFYLYIRTYVDAAMVYSRADDFYEFIRIFIRADYSEDTFQTITRSAHSDSGWFYAIRNVFTILSLELHVTTWIFIVAGLIAAFREEKTFGYILISIVVWGLLAKMTAPNKTLSFKDIDTASPYFLQMIPILAVVAAMGIWEFYSRIIKRSRLVSSAFLAGLIGLYLVLGANAFQKSSLSDDYTAYAWVRDISRVMKPKSFFLAFGDNPGFISFYGFGVERMRDDVLVLDTVPHHNDFQLNLSPDWKYAMWYPEFYSKEGTPSRYFLDIAKDQRLYASSVEAVPQAFNKRFEARSFTLLSMVLPKNSDKTSFNNSYQKSFAKIDYLSMLHVRSTDIMEVEMINRYLNTIWTCARISATENSKDSDYLYKLSIFMAKQPDVKFSIIEEYAVFLKNKRGLPVALAFVNDIRNGLRDAQLKAKLDNMKKEMTSIVGVL